MNEALHEAGWAGWATLLLGTCAIGFAVAHAFAPRRWVGVTSIWLVCSGAAMGLLGTALGMIHSFAAAAGIDPSMKATLLAKGISEAMNCTAFALAIVPLWLGPFLVGVIRRRTAAPPGAP